MIMQGMLHKNRCLQPNFRVVLKESDERKLFQWTELKVVCRIINFS